MRTPPRVSRAELDAALARIATRRDTVDDKNREMLGTEPAEVLDYLSKYSDRAIPSWVRQADVADGLVLHTWTWWQDRRRERALLRAGVREGLSLSQIGAPLGITSRQGVRDALDRLDALLEHDRPDETLTRDARRNPHDEDACTRWIRHNLDRLQTVAARLLAHADLADPEDREWIDELYTDYTDNAWSPASLTVLGMAAGELRAAPAVCELEHHHGVHRALAAADELRTTFSNLRSRKTTPS